MPDTVNDELADRIIRHAVFVERLKSQVTRDIVSQMNDVAFARMLARIESGLGAVASLPRPGGINTLLTLQRMESDYAAILRKEMRKIYTALETDLIAIGGSEANWVRGLLAQTTPVAINFEAPAPGVLRSIVKTQPMEGELLRKWWRRLSDSTQSSVTQEINRGLVLGEPVPRIVRRIRGTRAGGFADGVLQTSRRNAEAVVRTSVHHVTNHARSETYRANDDILKGEKYVATLDARTTDICASLDGRIWPVGEGHVPPVHIQCRSVRVPVMKSARELGLPIGDLPPATRASMNGQVPESVTYGQWLKRQPIPVQNEVLGVGRSKLFRRGKVPIDRFTTEQLRPLSLKELERLEASLP